MRGRLTALTLALLAFSPLPAIADTSLTAYDAARAALLAIWAELPLTIQNITLTDGDATGYGSYATHQGNSFAPGETIHIYAEVLGYGWRDNGDGTFSKLLDTDLALVDANGTTVASKAKFVTTDAQSRQKPLESDLAYNVTVTAFPPGAYKLQFTVHDRAGGKDAVFDVPITLVAADTSSEPPASDASSAASSSAP